MIDGTRGSPRRAAAPGRGRAAPPLSRRRRVRRPLAAAGRGGGPAADPQRPRPRGVRALGARRRRAPGAPRSARATSSSTSVAASAGWPATSRPLCRTLWAVNASDAMLPARRRRLAGRANVRYARCDGTRVPGRPDGRGQRRLLAASRCSTWSARTPSRCFGSCAGWCDPAAAPTSPSPTSSATSTWTRSSTTRPRRGRQSGPGARLHAAGGRAAPPGRRACGREARRRRRDRRRLPGLTASAPAAPRAQLRPRRSRSPPPAASSARGPRCPPRRSARRVPAASSPPTGSRGRTSASPTPPRCDSPAGSARTAAGKPGPQRRRGRRAARRRRRSRSRVAASVKPSSKARPDRVRGDVGRRRGPRGVERLVQEHGQRPSSCGQRRLARSSRPHPTRTRWRASTRSCSPRVADGPEEHRSVEAREARVLPSVGDAEDRLPGAGRARDAHALRSGALRGSRWNRRACWRAHATAAAGRLAGEATRRGRRRHARVGGLGGGGQPDRDRRAHGDVAEPVAHPHGDGVQPHGGQAHRHPARPRRPRRGPAPPALPAGPTRGGGAPARPVPGLGSTAV